MKKNYLLLVWLLFACNFLRAQTVETFETESNSSTSFNDNNVIFNITTQAGGLFYIQGNYIGTGWNGTANDNKYIDNTTYARPNVPVQFTVAAAGGATLLLKSMWLYLSTNSLNLSVTGSCTITGKLGGVTKFTATQSNPFNTSASVANGFTLIDMATYGGQDNTNIVIDQYVITTTGNIAYVSLDAMRWQCAPISITNVSQSNITCNGANNGTASLTATGGILSYNWTPGNPAGDSTASVTGLAPGIWTCTVTSTCSSSTSQSFTITEPDVLTATTSQTNVLCNGGTGSASVTPSGGTAAYSYLWAPSGGTGATASGLTPGNYNVTITDAHNCSIVKYFTITQPDVLTATTSQTNILCNGGATGSANVTPSGGAGNYTYAWLPSGGTLATATDLTAGNYNVTISDANNCSIIKYFTIAQPDAITAVTSQTDILCNGSATGSAHVTPSGGTGNYTYTWLPSGGTSATATGLTAGDYNVTIRDANNCSIIKYFTIAQPDAITATTSQTNVLCNGNATGSANVTPSGGSGSYTYAWLPTGGTSATATGLTAGNYNVTIHDVNNCSIVKYFTITQPDALTATTSQTDALCNNSGGAASVTAQGGTGSYTYAWLPSGGTSATVTGLTAGDYNVTIRDANNCSIIKYFTILQSAPVEVTASQTNVLCNGSSTGTATVTPTNSAVTYTYLWSPTGSTNATATGLAAGDHNVTITNADNCSIVHYFTITEPDALTASQFQYGINCNGGVATAGVTPTGGSGTYTYVWTPNVGNESVVFNLGAGDYNVVITDANGCNVTKYFTITEPAPLTATTSQLNINCTDTYSGTASVTPSGGSGVYTYAWSPYGGQEATATGLSDGDYTVTITDSNNCIITKDITITRPANIDVEITQTAATCTAAGSATAIATGGSGNFSYSWSPFGGNGAQATNLATGQYNVTITDNATNCNTTRELYISGPEECIIATSWNGSAWSNGAPDCVTYSAEINGDYNSAVNGEITACSLTVNSGTVIVAGGDNFIIKGSVIVAGGSLTFNNNANLVQTDYGENVGEITYNKNSSALYNLDYTIWSSPVTGSQTLKDFSPQTSDSRFYVYNTELGVYSNYTSASGVFGGNPDEVTFSVAKGYLIRMPEGSSGSTPTVYNGSFTGVPNNGYVSILLNRTGSRYNAVGNPYPSPINVKQFILQNQFELDNGTLYFWRKRNGGTGTSYATVTLAAYVAGTSEVGDTSGGAFNDGDEANWVINPAQGFLVKASEFATSLTFTNNMRKAVNNNQFFRTTAVSTDTSSKLWLNISNDDNEFGQAAIAYTDMTTLDIDYGYDGRLFNDGQISVYTIVEDIKLAIQARPQFNNQDEVPVGYKASNAGTYNISLDHFTGTFSGSQDIYLRDNLLGVTHNIKQSAYTFTTDAGTFNDRFSIVYTSTLGVAVPPININNIIVYQKENVITVNSGNEIIKDIHVYDLQGRLVYMREGINKIITVVTDLKAQEQMLVIQVTTTGGNKVSKKIIY